MSEKEIQANLWSLVRYLGKEPEGLTPGEKFYPAYDSHYVAQLKTLKLEAWHQKSGENYFLVSRLAPSLMVKRVAAGGRVRFDGNGEIIQYEEIFRTWKLHPDTLTRRSLILFDKMVTGASLTPYQTKFSNGIEFIEFPDERTYFDKLTRSWKSKE